MPVAAAREAEVLARDPNPLEVLGDGEHLLDQIPVLGLDLRALSKGGASLRGPLGQTVAHRLQLTKAEDPRRGGDGINPMRHLGVAEGLAEEAGQLRLEAADLTAQLDPRPSLVDPDPEPGEILSQKSGHQQEV
jgi:hypothetical protein